MNPEAANCNDSGREAVLPGYKSQLTENAVHHSRNKLSVAAEELKPLVGGCSIVSLPCTTEEDTLGYRCKCSFQIIHDGSYFHYAMRQNGEPVALGSSVFPVANRRIQKAMKDLMEQISKPRSPFGN